MGQAAASTAQASRPQPKVGGWHPVEWLCELIGTAFQLFCGFGVVALFEAPGSALRRDAGPGWLRLLIIGSAFGLLGAIVATSPVGRRSGAHLNPAVTIGFWARGHTSPPDVAGYVAGQTLGAISAAAAFQCCWRNWATEVNHARTVPGPHTGLPAALLIEIALTGCLVFTIFDMVSSTRTARYTPLVVTGVLAVLIRVGAPYTGASMNPARTFGPDLVANQYHALVIYLIGPPIGALAAAGAFTLFVKERTTLTAKLFHDPAYPTTQRSLLPAQPATTSVRTTNSRRSGDVQETPSVHPEG
jgi:aquaporin Z